MKNTSYFMLKAFFVLEIFNLLFWLLAYVEKRLDNKKPKNNYSKFMTPEARQLVNRI